MVEGDEGGRDVDGVAGGGVGGYGDWGKGLMWVGMARIKGVCGVWLMRVDGLGRRGGGGQDGLD